MRFVIVANIFVVAHFFPFSIPLNLYSKPYLGRESLLCAAEIKFDLFRGFHYFAIKTREPQTNSLERSETMSSGWHSSHISRSRRRRLERRRREKKKGRERDPKISAHKFIMHWQLFHSSSIDQSMKKVHSGSASSCIDRSSSLKLLLTSKFIEQITESEQVWVVEADEERFRRVEREVWCMPKHQMPFKDTNERFATQPELESVENFSSLFFSISFDDGDDGDARREHQMRASHRNFCTKLIHAANDDSFDGFASFLFNG